MWGRTRRSRCGPAILREDENVDHYLRSGDDAADAASGDAYEYDFWMLSGTDRERRHALRARLEEVGLRPTWQRMKIGMWVFNPPSKHFTPEDLFRVMQDEAVGERAISLATIYNTLNAFADADLLRTVTLQNGKRYYDTNTTFHAHLNDAEGVGLIDVPMDKLKVDFLPDLPPGYELDEMLVTIRIKRR